ncbi:NeuD/PglB/VioB family sugar acetyltransferase [Hyphobacterium sp. CCMP332]|nr:NeuD/PglB/VioB family sugar acetyltransferase [Hyphobacterium sp. CCMP332]
MDKNFVIFGCSGHARVVLENIISNGDGHFLGWIDNTVKKGTKVFGFPVIGNDEDLKNLYSTEKFSGIVGIGNILSRQKVVRYIIKQIPEFEFINSIHSSAIISPSANLGDGIAIMPGAIINSESKIGNHSIINTGAQIDHNCEVSEYVNISPAVIIGGNVRVSSNCILGMGAIVINNSIIPENTKVKAGSIFHNSN